MLEERLQRALDLTDSLAGALGDDALARDLGAAPANTIGAQLWCVVGARESYARALAAGRWTGFACSLDKPQSRQIGPVRSALARARAAVLEAVSGVSSDPRAGLAFDLLEHEVQHHGQLIRFFYANGLAFPADFARRYALK